MAVAVVNLVGVGLHSAGIGLLYHPSRREVVARGGQPQHRPVGQVKHVLHQPFAECAAADDDATVMVLHCSAEYLGCRCRIVIDEHDEAQPLHLVARTCLDVAPLAVAPDGVDDHVALAEETAHHIYRAAEVSAPVAAQVHHEAVHLAAVECRECFVKLVGCRRPEVEHADIAHARAQHHCRVYALDIDFAACHVHI